MTSEDEAELGELMRRAQAGDRAAYQELLSILAEACRPLAARRLPPDHVDDAVQNVLLAVHRARHTYDPSRPFGPWFHALARHRITDTWRRHHRSASRETSALAPELQAPHGVPDHEHDDLYAAVEQLTPRQRQVVQLLKLEDHSVREVAGRLDMSESAVKGMAHRAYVALRRLLGGADVSG